MKITFSGQGAAKSGAALVITASGVDHAYDGKVIQAAAKGANFHGKSGDGLETYVESGVRVFLRGRGDKDEFDYEMCAAAVAKSLRGSGVTELTIHLEGTDATADDAANPTTGILIAVAVAAAARAVRAALVAAAVVVAVVVVALL